MKKETVILGGAFNPPGRHHRVIAEELLKYFCKVIIYPSWIRPDKQNNLIDPELLMNMCRLTFGDMANVVLDFYDLQNHIYTTTVDLQKRFEKLGEMWYAIGADWATRDKIYEWVDGKFVFNNLNFAIITRSGFEIDNNNLPPRHKIINIETIGSSTKIRNVIKKGLPFKHLVCQGVDDIIVNNKLYKEGGEE